jgi:hypothetical protein
VLVSLHIDPCCLKQAKQTTIKKYNQKVTLALKTTHL